MSEYQCYEFQAIDRPLDEADREALQALSSRARITATSFVNHYDFGDFKGDPCKLMERWFDLHLYLANWGTRQLMIRLPLRFLNRSRLDVFLRKVEWVELRESGEHLIVDICHDDEESECTGWDDGSGWLAAMAPLRADVLGGDLRMFYLLWLTATEDGELEDDEKEPLPGIGPLTGPLEAFADFFHIDPGLVRAAAERTVGSDVAGISADVARRAIVAIPEEEKTALLQRLLEGDSRVTADIRSKVREAVAPAGGAAQAELRTVADLRIRAAAIRTERKAAEAERRRQAELDEKMRRARLRVLARLGAQACDEVDAEIERRNHASYGRAVRLLRDLRVLAEENGSVKEFSGRIRSLHERHARKRRFIELLAGLKLL